jgi:TPR repeat protein
MTHVYSLSLLDSTVSQAASARARRAPQSLDRGDHPPWAEVTVSSMYNSGVQDGEMDPHAERAALERAAEAGDVDAMYDLAVLVVRDEPDVGRGWYERAAEAGHAPAMNNLATLVAKEDPEAARRWYERSAEAGNPAAMVNLGVLQRRSGNVDAARALFERAAELGDRRAKRILRWRWILR